MAKRRSKEEDEGGGDGEGVSLFTVLVVAILFAAVLLTLPLILSAGERSLFKTNHANHFLSQTGLAPIFAHIYKPVNEVIRPKAAPSSQAARPNATGGRPPAVIRRPSTLDNNRVGQ